MAYCQLCRQSPAWHHGRCYPSHQTGQRTSARPDPVPQVITLQDGHGPPPNVQQSESDLQARSKLLNYLTEWQTLETNDWRKLREEMSGKEDLEREYLSIKINFLGKKVDTLVQITGEYLNRPNGP